MLYRRLGKSGLQLSAFSLGSWVTFGKQVHLDDAKNMIQTAFDLGINFFDNAEGYEQGESEVVMGNAIAALGLPRDEFCVSSKVFWGGQKPNQIGLSAKHVTEACHAALRRLQVDYLDLYFCHRPDIDTPIEETVRAMHNLITQGKVLYWGTSEWTSQQIMEAHSIARQNHLTPPTMEQPQYNLFERQKVEDEFRDIYTGVGLGTTIWSPLASGVLTGKYNKGIDVEGRLNLPGYEWLKEMYASEEGQLKIEKTRKLATIADDLGVPLHHMSLAWCLKNPNVSTVILGASKTEQLKDNVAALPVVEMLTPEIMELIDGVVQNRPAEPMRWADL
ncbi:potassium channel beta subunit family protein [Teredinibacter purpureus]|uniref:potassium channel beta subunit family protein n=1 Tax=Teredinibacter purpureus TaxID=2731756 RepID=UPI0005F7C8B9|nr:aldo/keto reductase [Teredinibacter purpureus]